MTNQLEYRFFVISLESAPWRWEKINKQCNKIGINCQKFTAVDWHNVTVTDLDTGYSCTGNQLKTIPIQLEKNKPYQVTCDNRVVEPAVITLTADSDSFIAGNIAVWCSKALLRKEIIKHKWNNTIIAEDDFEFNPINFIPAVETVILNAPSNYSIIYLDVHIHKGSTTTLRGNKFIAKFSNNSVCWGDQLHMVSYEGARCLDYGNDYVGTSDNYSWKLAKGKITKPTCGSFESYKASHNFSAISSIKYTGFSNNSIISGTGCRDHHNNSLATCNKVSISVIGYEDDHKNSFERCNMEAKNSTLGQDTTISLDDYIV